MLNYFKASIRGRWLHYVTILLILTLLGTGYTGAQITQERIVLKTDSELDDHWRWQYDILVYPKESQNYQGLGNGWIAPQTSLASYGGISFADLEKIKGIPGVEVAAPLSLIGYFNYDGLTAEYSDAEVGEFYESRLVSKAFDGYQHHILLDGKFIQEYVGRGNESQITIEDIHNKWSTGIIPPTNSLRFFNEMLLVAVDPIEEEKLYSISKSIIQGSDLSLSTLRRAENATIIPAIVLSNQNYQAGESLTLSKIHLPEKIDTESIKADGEKYLEQLPKTEIATISIPSYSKEWRFKNVGISYNEDGYHEKPYIISFSDRELMKYSSIHYQVDDHTDKSIPILRALEQEQPKNFRNGVPRYRTLLEDWEMVRFGVEIIGFYDASKIKPKLAKKWKKRRSC